MDFREGSPAHKRWYFFGLLRSVFASGDGKTAATAWKTISVPEGHVVLMALRTKPENRQLRMNPMVDVITAGAVNGGDPADIYFDPEWHVVRLQHSPSAPKSRPRAQALGLGVNAMQ